MNATERLRQLLDERGEHYETSGSKTWWGRPVDSRTGAPINIYHNQAQPMGEDRLFVELQLATPEQAIEATLGRGTCEVDSTIKWDWDRCEPYWEHELSCGHTVTTMEPEPPAFCPNCGRKVEEWRKESSA